MAVTGITTQENKKNIAQTAGAEAKLLQLALSSHLPRAIALSGVPENRNAGQLADWDAVPETSENNRNENPKWQSRRADRSYKRVFCLFAARNF
jgi:hypothetical protein